jgi:hypothetical protein
MDEIDREPDPVQEELLQKPTDQNQVIEEQVNFNSSRLHKILPDYCRWGC